MYNADQSYKQGGEGGGVPLSYNIIRIFFADTVAEAIKAIEDREKGVKTPDKPV